jgi:hypothetical protein
LAETLIKLAASTPSSAAASLEEAAALLRLAWRTAQTELGEDHPESCDVMCAIGALLCASGRSEKA